MKNYSTIIGVIALRLNGESYTTAQSRYNVGSSTVTHIMDRYKSLGLSLDELKSKAPEEVVKLFYPPEKMSRSKHTAAPDFNTVHRRMMEMEHPSLAYIWLDEYRKDNPDGYQLSQFYKLYKEFCEANFIKFKTSMAVERKPGENMYIDWMGLKPTLLTDLVTGELKEVHIFVTTLGVSSCIYAEAFMDETLPNFIAGVVHALEYYGAVPKCLVPDNLKAAVKKHTKYELVLNPMFADLGKFYGVAVLPPPPRKPKGKATVEQAVKFLETHLIEPLKKHVFTSLEALNEEVKKIVAEINQREFQDKDDIRKTRMHAFETIDKPEMKSLPHGNFMNCDYKYYPKVRDNYHLLYDNHYYSVLYTHRGKPAILRATLSEIIICDGNNQFICKHERLYGTEKKYSTHPEDLAPEHRAYMEHCGHDGAYYRSWAAKIGVHMAELIDRVLRNSEFEVQSYNSCSGILHMCDGHSDWGEEAATICRSRGLHTYSSFKRIYDNLVKEKGNDAPLK